MTYNVIIAATLGRLSGVDVFSYNLMQDLRRRGVNAQILLTDFYKQPSDTLPFPSNRAIKRLPISQQTGWRTRWQAMIRYLEEHAPCIYIPNYDWEHSCVSPVLSKQIGIVGIVHSDDPQHYEHVSRLGRYWNAIVAVSQAVAAQTATLDPTFAPRIVTIPYGVSVPSHPPIQRLAAEAALKIVYAGRLVQAQKRVLDLPRIVGALVESGTPIELTIIGGGKEHEQLLNACAPLVARGIVKFMGTLPNEQVLAVFEQSDVFILTSEYEGLPVSLLEAMGRGCVPVVSDVRSGIPEVVKDGLNGFRVSVGNIQGFADRLAQLQRDLRLRHELSSRAYDTICSCGYRTEDMTQSYLTLFQRVWEQTLNGSYCRPRGRILAPSYITWKDHLPASVRRAGTAGKQLLRQLLRVTTVEER